MAVPKKKTSKRRKNQRRSHHAIEVSYSHCAKCGEAILAHTVCENCGYYGDNKFLDVETKLDKKLKKKENKESKEQE